MNGGERRGRRSVWLDDGRPGAPRMGDSIVLKALVNEKATEELAEAS